jgi:putative NADPH-quinone reductase
MRTYVVEIQKGKIPRPVSEAIGALFKNQPDGKLVEITLREYFPKRSLQQNRYYWKVIVGAIREYYNAMGNNLSDDDIHEHIKQNICKGIFVRRIELSNGDFETFVRSSRTLNTREWEDMAETCRAWAAERGIDIPEPNEEIHKH